MSMSNTKFHTVSTKDAIARFEQYPELKRLFPHLYQQMSAQTDSLSPAYTQTYLLDKTAASEFKAFSDNRIESERSVQHDSIFTGYLGSLCHKKNKIP